MAIIKVSIQIDLDTTDVDIEDLRKDILDEVSRCVLSQPNEFEFEPVEP
jgi:hypothetical protein